MYAHGKKVLAGVLALIALAGFQRTSWADDTTSRMLAHLNSQLQAAERMLSVVQTNVAESKEQIAVLESRIELLREEIANGGGREVVAMLQRFEVALRNENSKLTVLLERERILNARIEALKIKINRLNEHAK